jgi:hypothetical protein
MLAHRGRHTKEVQAKEGQRLAAPPLPSTGCSDQPSASTVGAPGPFFLIDSMAFTAEDFEL